MAHKIFFSEGRRITTRNLFNNIKNEKKDVLNLSELELVPLIDQAYIEEKMDLKHAKDIALSRKKVRMEKGSKVIPDSKVWLWQQFVSEYSNREIPFNYEIESILKYLVYLAEGIYDINEVASMFVKEFIDLSKPSTVFILMNINNYAKINGYFFDCVKYIVDKNNKNKVNDGNKELIDNIVNKGIPFDEAEMLSNVKIVKLIESGHETTEVMSFTNGNKEGVDSHGNWIFMREINTPSSREFIVLFKINKDETIRYIIDKGTNIALLTNENGTYKDKVSVEIKMEELDSLDVVSQTERIENIITEIAVVGVSHDDAYKIANEMMELSLSFDENSGKLKLEEIYDEEIPKLKKNYE